MNCPYCGKPPVISSILTPKEWHRAVLSGIARYMLQCHEEGAEIQEKTWRHLSVHLDAVDGFSRPRWEREEASA